MSAICHLYEPTNLTLPMLLASSRWAILNLHKFYYLHELKATCRNIQNEQAGIVDTFPFISDVNFAFRDVSRLPRLLLAMSNIVRAQSAKHSADCDI